MNNTETKVLNLKQIRKALNLTQQEVARELDIPQANISYMENNKSDQNFIRYVLFLKEKGADLNDLTDN
ncbi:helix-turn-helix domain-containing protein [Parapedobacter sp. 10938]|uniref:helix-turn-helix domain-containing protein n=1 Tax=Parapedobacter flavus TaxID=3110225 RepID=UPI002DB63C60|nr:helix-turn-helix transcriptional regulator [Parapedobacter sp. 10938]MEC3881811.1 helix-turn-helix transcriptional regulator [Parapedobacter sp. 10938]